MKERGGWLEMTISTAATIAGGEDLASAHRYDDSKRRRPKRRYWEREREREREREDSRELT
jgi:hypothetical protein